MHKSASSTTAVMRHNVLTDAIILGPFAAKAVSAPVAKAFLIVIGSLLLAMSAQIKIPFYPVPVTGQTLVVLLIGMTYGPRLGGATVAAYLLQGALGLPVFAGTAVGMAALVGPTGGYLAGFLVAAVIMGFLAERGMGRSVISTVIAMMIGNAVIYAMGVAWLSGFIGMEKALMFGMAKFLYGDALKLVIAACLMPVAWRVVKSAQK
ncbi:biotin transporter BioY [Candidatus Puniceispirillum sp.]|nr:biotin transporter BioY [Alphaproteobacteria bacterium]MDC1294104.1 biotin transporter BioY [Candidatus Puniceispirillum sp.]